jgi:folate-dependent phosphoribosylglycinamide formyltransferase PurN
MTAYRSEDEPDHPLFRQKIRTVFCTSGGFLGAIVLSTLLRDEEFEVVGLVKSVRVFRPEMGFLRGAACFFGRCGILYTVYIWFITTALEFIGRMLGRETISVGVMARRVGFPVFNTRDLNSSEGHRFLASIKPQLIIAAHFDQRLDKDLCDGLKFAAVNLHPSLLPLHRGVEPVFQSLMRQENEVGVTLHRISEKIDHGRILAQQTTARDSGWSVLATSYHLMKSCSELLVSSKHLLLDRDSGVPQSQGGSYESWPQAREVYRLYKQRMALIRFQDLLLF